MSSYYFTKVLLMQSALVDHFHQIEMDQFLEKWEHGVWLQWIEWSRGFFKTTCFTQGTSMWTVLPSDDSDIEYAVRVLGFDEEAVKRRFALHDQDSTHLLAFNNIHNAERKVGWIKWHFEENQLFRACFPEIAYQGDERPWNSKSLRLRRVGYGRTEPEGTFDAIGVGGGLESRHYTHVWEDDLVDRKTSQSATELDSVCRWHDLLDGAFRQASKQIRTGVSNRWGYNDLNSYVRSTDKTFFFHTRKAIEYNPLTEREEAVFPERLTIEDLRLMESKGEKKRHEIAAQYYNEPRLPGEREVNLDALHYYEVSSEGQIQCSCGAKFLPSQLQRYMAYDPYNAKDQRSTSCPAIVVVGTSPKFRLDDKLLLEHVFLLDYFTTRKDYTGVYSKLFEWNDRWGPQLFVYEDVANQNMCEFYIKQQQTRPDFDHRRFSRIVGVTCGGKSKPIRIRDKFLPLIDAGRFSCRRTHKTFLDQCETFPLEVNGHDYDILDALEDLCGSDSYGTSLMTFPKLDTELKARKAEEDAYLAELGKPYSQMETSRL